MSVQNWQSHNSSTLKLYVPAAHVATLLLTANILQIVYAVGGSPRKFRYFKKFNADALVMTYDQYHYSSVEASSQTFSIGTSEANKTMVGRENDAYYIYMWYEGSYLYLNTTAPGGHASSQFNGNNESGTTGDHMLAQYNVADPGGNCSLSDTTITQYTGVSPTISNAKQFMLTNRESFMSGTYTQSTGHLSSVSDYTGAPFSGWGIEPCWAKYLRKLSVSGIAVWEFTAPHDGEFQFYISQSTLNFSSVYSSALSSPPSSSSNYTTQSTGNNAHILITPQSMNAGNAIYFTFATSFWGYNSGSTGGAGAVAVWYTAPSASSSSVVDFTVRGMDASHNTLVSDTESALIEPAKFYQVNVDAVGVDHWGWRANGGAETMMSAGSTSFIVNGSDYSGASSSGPRFEYISADGTSLTWEQANTAANARGGRLASPKTNADLTELNNYLSTVNYGIGAWIGLKRDGSYWRWVDGSVSAISNWLGGEPNNAFGNEDYVHVLANIGNFGSTNHNWNDSDNAAGNGSHFGSPRFGYIIEYT